MAQGADAADHDLDGLAERVADPQPEARPQHDAREIVEHEPEAGTPKTPARGGITVVSPGRNFDTSSARTP